MDHKVVTRFAPSPTGYMHIGGVRTALFAFLYAKQQGGEFILRIEDTDKEREVPGSIEHIQQSLRWLGIEWEYGPDKAHPEWGSAIQSERLDTYKQYVDVLLEKGLAYCDKTAPEEMARFREADKAAGRPFLFRNHRREWPYDEGYPIRLKVTDIKRYEWTDTVRGQLSAGEEALDDFIIMKADGYPTYNFAHIIDDLQMGVTHVMRGEEFISSMPKFLSLYDALEIPWPTFVTLPPIMGPDGKKKLSKRDGAKDLLEYRDDGYLPEAMANFLALIGWNPGSEQEYFNAEELLQAFSLERIQKSGGVFNEEKLQWLNKQHIEHLPEPEKIDYVLEALPTYDKLILTRFAPTILERVHTQTEIRQAAEAGEYAWAFGDIEYDASLLQWKNDESEAASLPRLQQVIVLLEAADFTSPETIKTSVWAYAEEVGKGEVLWPTRVALTGREQSPDPFTSAYILGKDEALQRLTAACAKIEG